MWELAPGTDYAPIYIIISRRIHLPISANISALHRADLGESSRQITGPLLRLLASMIHISANYSTDLGELSSQITGPLRTLLASMMARNPDERPTIETVLAHPYFRRPASTVR